MSEKRCLCAWCGLELMAQSSGLVIVDNRAHYVARSGGRKTEIATVDTQVEAVPEPEISDSAPAVTTVRARKHRRKREPNWANVDTRQGIVVLVAQRKAQAAARAAKRAQSVRAVQQTDLSAPVGES
jgi:hypothetical protein